MMDEYSESRLVGDYYIHFDKRTFTNPNDSQELEWKLRYGELPLTRTERLILASLMNSYTYLIGTTQKDRNYVCKRIKEALPKHTTSGGEE